MKYILTKNEKEIQTFKNKLDLYEYWERLQNYLIETNNFHGCAGFWMMSRERNIYEVRNSKNEVLKYDADEFERMKKRNEHKFKITSNNFMYTTERRKKTAL